MIELVFIKLNFNNFFNVYLFNYYVIFIKFFFNWFDYYKVYVCGNINVKNKLCIYIL